MTLCHARDDFLVCSSSTHGQRPAFLLWHSKLRPVLQYRTGTSASTEQAKVGTSSAWQSTAGPSFSRHHDPPIDVADDELHIQDNLFQYPWLDKILLYFYYSLLLSISM